MPMELYHVLYHDTGCSEQGIQFVVFGLCQSQTIRRKIQTHKRIVEIIVFDIFRDYHLIDLIQRDAKIR